MHSTRIIKKTKNSAEKHLHYTYEALKKMTRFFDRKTTQPAITCSELTIETLELGFHFM